MMTNILKHNRGALISLTVISALVVLVALQFEARVSASILLSGLTLGALFFLVAAGLSLIFGLMDVLNFAHGLFFMIGAYIGYTMYANPRMLLNTLPLFLAMAGAAALGTPLGRMFLSRYAHSPADRFIGAGLWSGVVGLAFVGAWGLNLIALASSSETSTGGIITTEQAQEPLDRYVARLLFLIGAGLLMGLALGRKSMAHREANRAWARGPIIGAAVIALAFLIALWRLEGETALLGLPSNARFVLALVAGAGVGAALGGLVEWSLIRPLYSRPIYQVLLTLGLVFVGTELIKGIWGPTGFFMETPDSFNTTGRMNPECRSASVVDWLQYGCNTIDVMGRPFPTYRLFIIFLGVVIFGAVALLLKRSRLGMIIRAGVQDSDMVQALGINVRKVFTLVFALGTGLAALGGVAAAPFVGVNPGLAQEFILYAFIAVVIGGMGSYTGAALGALLLGLARAFGDQLVVNGIQLPGLDEALRFSPSVARASLVLLMAVVLLIRPAGLLGKKE